LFAVLPLRRRSRLPFCRHAVHSLFSSQVGSHADLLSFLSHCYLRSQQQPDDDHHHADADAAVFRYLFAFNLYPSVSLSGDQRINFSLLRLPLLPLFLRFFLANKTEAASGSAAVLLPFFSLPLFRSRLFFATCCFVLSF
jgi:hypothetical protein